MASIIRNDGIIVPNVMKNAPQNFLNLYPMNIAMFTAKIPGTVWANAIKSKKSSFRIHFFLSTISASISGIIAYPPPIVNKPMRKNIINEFM